MLANNTLQRAKSLKVSPISMLDVVGLNVCVLCYKFSFQPPSMDMCILTQAKFFYDRISLEIKY